MAKFAQSLTRWPCGPGSHEVAEMEADFGFLDENRRIPRHTMTICRHCGKSGMPATCGACESETFRYAELSAPGGGTVTTGLCEECYDDLLEGAQTEGWVFIQIAPDPPDDPT